MKIKIIGIIFLFFGLALLTQAQTPAEKEMPPDLIIVKFNWSKERIGWERDPFLSDGENEETRRARLRQEKRAQDAKKSGTSSEANRQEDDIRIANAVRTRDQQQTKPPRYVFLYKLQVKNTGQKTIKAVYWDYVFYDASTKREVGRRQFLSEKKIRPGKSESLEFTIPTPPAQVISVHSLDKKETEGLQSEVVILRIEYDDETIWERPQ